MSFRNGVLVLPKSYVRPSAFASWAVLTATCALLWAHRLPPKSISGWVLLVSFFGAVSYSALVFLWTYLRAMQTAEAIQANLLERREAAEATIKGDSKDPQAAWDLARTTLELYFNRNLQQVKLIFYVAVAVMLVGFAFVVLGVSTALAHPHELLGPIIATLSGTISQFIGVTFMQIYRATMQQANEYVSVLDRINAVGMSVQIIQGIPEDDPLSVQTRAEVARLLLTHVDPTMRSRPSCAIREKPSK